MTLGNFFDTIINFIDITLVQVVFSIAFIVFLWGLYQYFIAGAADEEKRKKGRQFVMYGILGFVIMVSIWGIVNIVLTTFNLQGGGRPDLPLFGGSSSQTQTQTLPSPTLPSAPNNQSGKPLGALCPSRLDSECASGECDWNGGSLDAQGQQVFVCVAPRTN